MAAIAEAPFATPLELQRPDLTPLLSERITELQSIRSLVGARALSEEFGSHPALTALRAAAFAESFTKTIALDPNRNNVLAVKFEAMEVLGQVEHARLAADSLTRNDVMFHATQRRIFDHYPDMEQALLHPDTGVGYLSFERVVASLNSRRPPILALLDQANFASIDGTREQVLGLYYEAHAQKAESALQRMHEDRPQWMRRWVTKAKSDGSVETVGEELVDITEERRTKLTLQRYELLHLQETTLMGLPPLSAADTLVILEDIRDRKYETGQNPLSENDFQIAA